jgi:hypothetical protein
MFAIGLQVEDRVTPEHATLVISKADCVLLIEALQQVLEDATDAP